MYLVQFTAEILHTAADGLIRAVTYEEWVLGLELKQTRKYVT